MEEELKANEKFVMEKCIEKEKGYRTSKRSK
jgi:hypothetical protein